MICKQDDSMGINVFSDDEILQSENWYDKKENIFSTLYHPPSYEVFHTLICLPVEIDSWADIRSCTGYKLITLSNLFLRTAGHCYGKKERTCLE